MAPTEITFPTDDGRRPGLLAVPPGGGHAAILFVHENRGLTPYMIDVIENLAALGAVVSAPDLMSRIATRDEETTTRSTPMERHVADIRSALDDLERRVPGRPVAIVGFCFGGEAAMAAALGRRELACVVSFYGVPPVQVADLPDPVLIVLASDDERVNRSTEAFLRALDAAAKDYVIQSYPGTQHAFHDWSRSDRHAPRAAEAAWRECRAFLTRHLMA